MIKVIDVINTKYAVSREDGRTLGEKVKIALSFDMRPDTDKILVDFDGISNASSTFLNGFITELSIDELKQISIKSITKLQAYLLNQGISLKVKNNIGQ